MDTTLSSPSSAKAIWLLPLSGISVALMLGWTYMAMLDVHRGDVTPGYTLSFLCIPAFPLINALLTSQLLPKHEWRRRLPSLLVAGLAAGLVYAFVFMLLALNTIGS
jgi:hypothetical protein